ncbi:MAG: hypothetical protein U9Q81_13190 [Pseudomonadota bacterium]|nr:hypothetical protein [Pseudomonadota bacterium]
MTQPRSAETLLDLFASETVVDLPRIQVALGSASSMTACRYLRQVPYRRSYNHNGRYYCLHEPSRYDRLGLWSVGDVHFSVDGSLTKTVRRLVYEMEAGATHRELQERVRVRVHNTLLTLLRRGEIERERLAQLYVYLHRDAAIREVQIPRRGALLNAGETARIAAGIPDEIVIQVLLTLLHRPGAKAAEVVRYLRAHSPPVSMEQVGAVFARYDLESIGKKGGSSKS